MRNLYITSVLFIILCTASNLYSPSNSPNLLAEEKHQETQHSPPFYFPPSQTCPLTINTLELISSFNTFSALLDQLQGIHFYKDDISFLAGNSYVQLTTCSACTTERIIQLTEQNGDILTTAAKAFFKVNGGTGKVSIKIETDGVARTIDGIKLPIPATGTPSSQYPHLTYSSQIPKFASAQDIDNCLCSAPIPTLPANLQDRSTQLSKQINLLKTDRIILRSTLINLIQTFTTQHLNTENNDKLSLRPSPPTDKSCFSLKLSLGHQLIPETIPTSIHPSNLITSIKTLSTLIDNMNLYTRKVQIASAVLTLQSPSSPTLQLSTIPTSIRQVWDRLSAHQPDGLLIIILISSLSITLCLVIILPILICFFLRRGMINLQRFNPDRHREMITYTRPPTYNH